jgi:DNA-binding CsgD family transcriptional regulator
MENKFELKNLVQKLNVKGSLNDYEFESFLNSGDFIDQLCINNSTFYLFLDIHKMKYQFVSPNIINVLGYAPELFMEHGVETTFNTYLPSTILTQKAIHNEMHQILESSSKSDKLKFKFSFNVRIKNTKNNYVWLLQNNRVIKLDSSGKPLLMLIVCTKIDEFISNERQTLVVSKIDKGKEKIIHTKHFFPEYENGILTRREMDVWKLLNEGHSSKIIAEKLDMKVNTVFTHRKKINKKLKNGDNK